MDIVLTHYLKVWSVHYKLAFARFITPYALYKLINYL